MILLAYNDIRGRKLGKTKWNSGINWKIYKIADILRHLWVYGWNIDVRIPRYKDKRKKEITCHYVVIIKKYVFFMRKYWSHLIHCYFYSKSMSLIQGLLSSSISIGRKTRHSFRSDVTGWKKRGLIEHFKIHLHILHNLCGSGRLNIKTVCFLNKD